MMISDRQVEDILRRHGVEDEGTELKKGPRAPKKIDAIVRDIQHANNPQ